MFKPNVYNLETSVCIAHEVTGEMYCGVYPSSGLFITIRKLNRVKQVVGEGYCIMKCSTANLIAEYYKSLTKPYGGTNMLSAKEVKEIGEVYKKKHKDFTKIMVDFKQVNIKYQNNAISLTGAVHLVEDLCLEFDRLFNANQVQERS